jgi:2'-5' RNA ligase
MPIIREGIFPSILNEGFFMTTYRLFLAKQLPSDYKARIRAFKDLNANAGFRWISENNWHLTLLFIGAVPAEAVADLKKVLKSFFDTQKPLTLHPKGFYFAPRLRHARMIWLSFFHSEPFDHLVENLFQLVRDYMENNGYDLNQNLPRQITPHVTLARFKPFDARQAKLAASPSNEEFQPLLLDQSILMASERTSMGAVYTPLSHYTLKNRG